MNFSNNQRSRWASLSTDDVRLVARQLLAASPDSDDRIDAQLKTMSRADIYRAVGEGSLPFSAVDFALLMDHLKQRRTQAELDHASAIERLARGMRRAVAAVASILLLLPSCCPCSSYTPMIPSEAEAGQMEAKITHMEIAYFQNDVAQSHPLKLATVTIRGLRPERSTDFDEVIRLRISKDWAGEVGDYFYVDLEGNLKVATPEEWQRIQTANPAPVETSNE